LKLKKITTYESKKNGVHSSLSAGNILNEFRDCDTINLQLELIGYD
jgi:hypothetical protein